MLTSVPGNIISPGYPHGYANDLQCMWIIDAGEEVKLFIIHKFEMCDTDKLRVSGTDMDINLVYNYVKLRVPRNVYVRPKSNIY